MSIVSGQAVVLEGRCSSTDVSLGSLILAFVESNGIERSVACRGQFKVPVGDLDSVVFWFSQYVP